MKMTLSVYLLFNLSTLSYKKLSSLKVCFNLFCATAKMTCPWFPFLSPQMENFEIFFYSQTTFFCLLFCILLHTYLSNFRLETKSLELCIKLFPFYLQQTTEKQDLWNDRNKGDEENFSKTNFTSTLHSSLQNIFHLNETIKTFLSQQ